jgi:hypothetical protein
MFAIWSTFTFCYRLSTTCIWAHFFGPDFELGESVYEAKEEMCPDACCGKPITECKCGPDCEHCDCHSKNSAMNEGMEFDEKRNDDLQVVAKDMFKNALANAKKKVK